LTLRTLKKTHEEHPSNEIQTTLNVLFKEHERGLYTQDLAKVAGFPRAIHPLFNLDLDLFALDLYLFALDSDLFALVF
jgi:hypothetical protein